MSQVRPSLAGVAVAWLLLGPSPGLAQPAAPPAAGAVPTISVGAQPVADQLAALVNEIQALRGELSQLLERLAQHRSLRPAAPGDGASDAAKEQYAQALLAWETQQAALQRKIELLRARANELAKRLDKLESQLSAAQRGDAKRARSELDAVGKQLAGAEESTSAGSTAPRTKQKAAPGSILPAAGASP